MNSAVENRTSVNTWVPGKRGDHVEFVAHGTEVVHDCAHELAGRRAVGFEVGAQDLDLHRQQA